MHPSRRNTRFKLWAPSAQQVAVCTYDGGSTNATAVTALQADPRTGIWRADLASMTCPENTTATSSTWWPTAPAWYAIWSPIPIPSA
ncbi:hypothetical protein LP419_27575 [Massilia sp. H-1]|nr:hypothetical protein LP419_27575 [Massilia sp. H-1]